MLDNMETEKVAGYSLNIGDKVFFSYYPTDPNSAILKVCEINREKNELFLELISGDFKYKEMDANGIYPFSLYGTWDRIKSNKPSFNPLDVIMGNLEFYPLLFCLIFLYNAKFDWKLWVTILSVSICAGISTWYIKRKK